MATVFLAAFVGATVFAAEERDADPGFLPELAPGLGPGVRLVIRPLQSFNGHMGIDLGGRERSVAEKLLNRPQVRAAFKQVSGCCVPQSVGG